MAIVSLRTPSGSRCWHDKFGPWRDANPLLMKIGQQLQQQAGGASPGPFPQGPVLNR